MYGAYSFSELLLQKIWLRGDFDRVAAVTEDGRKVQVLHPGRWNRLGGPDFREARLRLGDALETTGDVEVHLRAGDWEAHGHARDPAYGRVILHVVLFPTPDGRRTLGGSGTSIPVLALLPLLRHDLEEFAADDAVERLAGRPLGRMTDELVRLKPEDLKGLMRSYAGVRWRRKVHFARLRVQRLGFDAACHQTALEILGYRFNRAPMLRLAARFPLRQWSADGLSVESLVADEAGAWSLQGVRPANHPRVRLGQYWRWARACPGWPETLTGFGAVLPRVLAEQNPRAVRRECALGKLRNRLAETVCAGGVGGTRFDTLVVDGMLPLLVARSDLEAELFGVWFHWFPGDLPPAIPRALRELGISDGARSPLANGPAQGLLGWWWAKECGSVTPEGRGA
jgi:hypothetical protein